MANKYIQSLDLVRDGDWAGAHSLIQSGSDKMSCLIHGYLHREEGDMSNAAYWYRRAGEDLPQNTLPAELERLYSLVERAE